MKRLFNFKVLIITVGFLSLIVAYAIGRLTMPAPAPDIEVKENVITKEIINYPALQSLSANVTGRVSEVGESSFKVTNGSSSITLQYEPNGITEIHLAPSNEEISVKDLQVNDLIRGGVTMIVSPENAVGFTNKKPGDIVAHFFTVERVSVADE